MTILDTLEQESVVHPKDLPVDHSRTVILDFGFVQGFLRSGYRLGAHLLSRLIEQNCTRTGHNDGHANLIIDAHYAPDNLAERAETVWTNLFEILTERGAMPTDLRIEVEYWGKQIEYFKIGQPEGTMLKVCIFTAGYFAACREDDHYWREIFDDACCGMDTERLQADPMSPEDLTAPLFGFATSGFDLATSLSRGDVCVETNEHYDGMYGLDDIILIMDRTSEGKPNPRPFAVVRDFNAYYDMPDREQD